MKKMVRRLLAVAVVLCLLFCGIIASFAETNNTDVFTIFDDITFSSPLGDIEERMEKMSYQKVASYGLFNQYGFYHRSNMLFGAVASSVWFDMENEKLIRIRILYDNSSEIFDNVLTSLLDEYGFSVFDYNEDNAKVYAWWPDDAQVYFGGAPWDSTIEDAKNGDVLSMITITPYEKQFSYDDLLRMFFGK